jgi:hypothetical protein
MFGDNKFISKKAAWEEFANEMGARYEEGRLGYYDKVLINYKQWVFILDLFSRTNGKTRTIETRLRVSFVNKNNFALHIRNRNIFNKIIFLFKRNNVEIGQVEIDNKYFVETNDHSKAKELLCNPDIRQILDKVKGFNLEIVNGKGLLGTKFPEKTNEMRLKTYGIIKDRNHLKLLIELYKLMLDRFIELGIASDDAIDLILD